MACKQDPFQLFQVNQEPCDELIIRVIEGRHITKGVLQDLFDVPDPYVAIHVEGTIDSKKRTKTIDNNSHPLWNEDVIYYLKPKCRPEGNKATVAEISLYDDNYGTDGQIGETISFDLNQVEYNVPIKKTLRFAGNSLVEVEFKRVRCKRKDVRHSLALCDKEKEFRKSRKQFIFKTMKKFMGADAPRTMAETPTIAVMGSGGGYRAMVAFYGVLAALEEMELLNCTMYTNGLSGSTWTQSTLYTNPGYPITGVKEAAAVVKKNIETNPLWLLQPLNFMKMVYNVSAKKRNNKQPVTITDAYGYFVGEHLLGQKRLNETHLSDMEKKIRGGKAPMPLMTCLHVRSDVSAMVYHEWVEFSPYEIGMAKYGTFVPTKRFNDKFFMGTRTKSYDEAPLHFLMGIWGSAFGIILKRVMKKDGEKKKKLADDEQGKDIRDIIRKEFSGKPRKPGKPDDNGYDSSDDEDHDSEYDAARREANNDEYLPHWGDTVHKLVGNKVSDSEKPATSTETAATTSASDAKTRSDDLYDDEALFGRGYVSSMFSKVYETLFESRSYNAGKVLNFMRGFAMQKTFPFHPFSNLLSQKTVSQVNEFELLGEAMSSDAKKVFVVDAGLTYNSPYPPLLRPQRKVDIILSFDFSKRAVDNMQPFQELLLAEKWARCHNVPFPKIDVDVFEREGMKECYVFRDEEDDRVPIVLHFPICNVNYKYMSEPGVKRETGDKGGDFGIFYKGSPYSTFNFQYKPEEFDNLYELMRFNTLASKDIITRQIKKSIQGLRKNPHMWTVRNDSVKTSPHVSDHDKSNLRYDNENFHAYH